MAKRSDEDRSKTSSSDYGDVVQKDIRHFLQKKEGTSSCSITCLNAEEKMHGPQSDDTMILSSDEGNSGQTEDEDWIDTTRVQSWTKDVERPASVSTKGMIDSMGRRNQLEDKDESEEIGDNEERKRIKLDLKNQVESNTEFSEDTGLLIQMQEDNIGLSQSEEDKEVENILGYAKPDPVMSL
jgi:hypothetical protein